MTHRPFARERRTLPPRRTQREIHVLAIEAVAEAISPQPLADDLSRPLRNRTRFPEILYGATL